MDLAADEAVSGATAEEITRCAAGRLPGLVNDVVARVRRDVATRERGNGAGMGPAP
ncbi:hypothetical protein [Actinoplanes sp. NPDC049118]|uniref:hypothetical protein n=1 Tax=Actinoplanes sp. NPDC049118 TaxID=3155769 RepID=UPI0033F2F06B